MINPKSIITPAPDRRWWADRKGSSSIVAGVLREYWASRYTGVGPNQVLIVSGRKFQLPDGRFIGFRMVKSGDTFVYPEFEKADALSLEVMRIDMPRVRARTAGGRAMEADCVAQVNIRSDDTSIVVAAERFLSKSPAEIKDIVRPVLEKHLSRVLESSNVEEVNQNPAACAAKVQSAASADLAGLGLGMVSFTIHNGRAA